MAVGVLITLPVLRITRDRLWQVIREKGRSILFVNRAQGQNRSAVILVQDLY
jgi:hypothetical protein